MYIYIYIFSLRKQQHVRLGHSSRKTLLYLLSEKIAPACSQIMELGLEPIGEMLQGDAFSPLTADELSGLIR